MASTMKLPALDLSAVTEAMTKNTAISTDSVAGKDTSASGGINSVTSIEPKASVLTDTELKKVGVSFNIPKFVRNKWKTYFASHGLTMTDGLIQAVDYLIEQEERGEVKVGAISILKN